MQKCLLKSERESTFTFFSRDFAIFKACISEIFTADQFQRIVTLKRFTTFCIKNCRKEIVLAETQHYYVTTKPSITFIKAANHFEEIQMSLVFSDSEWRKGKVICCLLISIFTQSRDFHSVIYSLVDPECMQQFDSYFRIVKIHSDKQQQNQDKIHQDLRKMSIIKCTS